jgi:hypothetical protein
MVFRRGRTEPSLKPRFANPDLAEPPVDASAILSARGVAFEGVGVSWPAAALRRPAALAYDPPLQHKARSTSTKG